MKIFVLAAIAAASPSGTTPSFSATELSATLDIPTGDMDGLNSALSTLLTDGHVEIVDQTAAPARYRLTPLGAIASATSGNEAGIDSSVTDNFNVEFELDGVTVVDGGDIFLAGLRANGVTAAHARLLEYTVTQWACRRAVKTGNPAMLAAFLKAWRAARSLAVSI
jgi:hypothetical protein